jgi:hypothetical protein
MLLDTVSVPLFYALSRVRGARVFHPRGAAYEAIWRSAADSPLDLWGPTADVGRQAAGHRHPDPADVGIGGPRRAVRSLEHRRVDATGGVAEPGPAPVYEASQHGRSAPPDGARKHLEWFRTSTEKRT